MRVPELRPRQPLVGAAIAAAAGIVMGDRWAMNWQLLVLLLLLCAVAVFWRPRALQCWIFVALAFATLHTLRHHQSEGRRLGLYLASGAQPVQVIGVVAGEPAEVKVLSRTPASRFQLRFESVEIGGGTTYFGTLVNVYWTGSMPAYGDRVEIRGTVENIAPPRNPGEFDYRAYAHRQGIYSEVRARYAGDCRIVGKGHGNPVYVFAFAARQWMREQLALDLNDAPTIAALISSMVLGLRGETPEEIQDYFRTTGTLHLFAVSGLNVAMLAAIAWKLMKPLRVNRRMAVFITIPIILCYALITGLSASCSRAAIMGSIVLAGLLFDRPPSLFNSLAAAALLILAWDTNQLFLPGFQFSFVLVIALAWLSERVQRRIEPIGRPDEFLPSALWSWRQRVQVQCWNGFASTFGVTMAAWLGSLAFTAGYFHLFSPAAIVANLIAVPIAFAILALGLFAVLAAPFSNWLAILFNNANWAFAKLLLLVVELCAHAPGGHVYVEVPRNFSRRPEGELTIFDLGPGGAIHLRAGSEHWLIDCGQSFEYERIVLPYLRSRGVNRLDALVLTHGDVRHIGAAQDAWKDLQPLAIFDSAQKDRSQTRRALHKALAQQRRGKRLVRRGDIAETTGQLQIEILYPPVELSRSVADDKALVLRFKISGTRVLLMSDSGFATERWLMENEPDLSADVLVKGWHSKDFSGTADFLTRVHPQIIVAGATESQEALGPLTTWTEQNNATLFLQQNTGAVQVEFQHGGITAKGTLNGQSLRGRAVPVSSKPASLELGPPGSGVHD